MHRAQNNNAFSRKSHLWISLIWFYLYPPHHTPYKSSVSKYILSLETNKQLKKRT